MNIDLPHMFGWAITAAISVVAVFLRAALERGRQNEGRIRDVEIRHASLSDQFVRRDEFREEITRRTAEAAEVKSLLLEVRDRVALNDERVTRLQADTQQIRVTLEKGEVR